MKTSRVLIKISGEAISGEHSIFDSEIALEMCNNIRNIINSGVNVSLVIGGGNIIRGRNFASQHFISRETADSVGMLGTVMNGIVFRDIFQKMNLESELISNLKLPFNIQPSDKTTIQNFQHKILIFVGGIGYPYFSTDTVAAVAANLSNCDAILKATNTDGVYDKDPNKFKDAQFISKLTYEDAIALNIGIMDKTAFSILLSNKRIKTLVFSIKSKNCFESALNRTIKLSEIV